MFSTKNRVAFLQSSDLRLAVHAYLTATLRGLDCEPVQVGGVADHVHLLFSLARTIPLADLVKRLKTSSTKVMREKVTAISVGKPATALFLSVNQAKMPSPPISSIRRSTTGK